MKILVVSQYFWPENFRINDLVSEFVKRGHDVTVLTGLPNYPSGSIFTEFEKNPAAFSQYGGAKIVRVPIVLRKNGGIWLMLNFLSYAISASTIGVWRIRGEKFDAIFAYQVSPVTIGLPAVLFRKLKKAPLTMWVLDMWPETLEAVGAVRSPSILKLVGAMVSFIYDRCDLIVAQSRSFIPRIRQHVPDKVVEYFPSWAESHFGAGDVARAPELCYCPDRFNIMFAGNIGEAQDFPTILAAAEEVKNACRFRWLIVGDGRLSDWVAKEIVRRQLQDTVLMLGRYPVERMPSFYKHADAMLVSLKDEPIFAMTVPGKLQSYLAAGMPVVAMLNGEGADVIERSGAGVTCRAGDVRGLVSAIQILASLPHERLREMSRNALSITVNEFDRDNLIDGLESSMLDLTASGRK